jgi:hypothetical protein
MTDAGTEHEHDEWRAQNPLLALNEAVGVVVGMVITHTEDETLRKQVVTALIEAHKKAQAEFEAVAAGRGRRLH